MSTSTESQKPALTGKILGVVAMIGAPMLLIEFLVGPNDSAAVKTSRDQLFSLIGVMYMTGWIAGAIGMRRLRATGSGLGATVVFVVQMIMLFLAWSFSVMEAFGYSSGNGGVLFAITDAGYPLSHLFMLVVGIMLLRAKVWSGIARLAPFLVGMALPVFFALSGFAGVRLPGIAFGITAALGLGIIGFKVLKQS